MFKKLLFLFLLLVFFQSTVYAVDLFGTDTYYGKINSIAIGFFGNVGIALESGTTCNDQSVVVLLTSSSKYKDILSLLLTAEISQKEVHMYRVASELSTFGTPPYCVITEAGLGQFPLWPVNN